MDDFVVGEATVPLVVYINGERKVVGRANVKGHEIHGELTHEYSQIFGENHFEFSLDPIPAKPATRMDHPPQTQGGAKINLKHCRYCGCALTYKEDYVGWAENYPEPNCPKNPAGSEKGHILKILDDDKWT
jgi:hypothetical protein